MPVSLHPLLPLRLPLEWLRKASCRGSDLSIDEFFPPPSKTLRKEVAEMCRNCSVRIECLKWAYDQDLTAGWFGGMSAGQRERHTFDELRDRILDEQQSQDPLGAGSDEAA